MCEVPGVSKEIKDDETLTVTFIDSIGGEPDTIGLSGKTLRKMAERIPPDEPCNHDWLWVREVQQPTEETILDYDGISVFNRPLFKKGSPSRGER